MGHGMSIMSSISPPTPQKETKKNITQTRAFNAFVGTHAPLQQNQLPLKPRLEQGALLLPAQAGGAAGLLGGVEQGPLLLGLVPAAEEAAEHLFIWGGVRVRVSFVCC